MELKTSRERHSRRRSLLTLIHVSRAMDMLPAASRVVPLARQHSCLNSRHKAAINQLAMGEHKIFVGEIGE